MLWRIFVALLEVQVLIFAKNVTSTKKIDWCCDIRQIHTREEELE